MTDDDSVRCAVGDLFQPFSPAYQANPARAFYLRAHAEAPVAYSRNFSAWLVTGHAEVTAVLRDPRLFSSTRILDLPPQPPEVLAVLSRGVFPLPRGLFNNDPPAHTRVRLLVSKAFSAARTAALEPTIRSTAAALLAALPEDCDVVDLMHTFVFPLPMAIGAALAGVPQGDALMLKTWQDEWFNLYRQELSLERRTEAAHAVVEHHAYLRELVQQRRVTPRDDLATALVQARDEDNNPLSTEEIISHLIVLFVAGYETAAGLLGSLVLRLLGNLSLWNAAADDEVLSRGIIEETLRVDAPVQMEPRHTTADAVLAGVRIPAGATVFPFFGAANYDSKQFSDPLRFDPNRSRSPRHYAFGHGVHACIGASLGRLEAQTALRALRAAFPRLRLADGARPAFMPSMFFRVPAELPVVLNG